MNGPILFLIYRIGSIN